MPGHPPVQPRLRKPAVRCAHFLRRVFGGTGTIRTPAGFAPGQQSARECRRPPPHARPSATPWPGPSQRASGHGRASGATEPGAVMKVAWVRWLASVMPPPAAGSLCRSTTLYLEARDQSTLGQHAAAEVALRRADSGLWGDSVCEVVTARKQFAPTVVSPRTRLTDTEAW